jgi:CHASE2 domain-containing sensor protein/serine phosphatase RsbU (regulator of sigma subunit)
MKPEDLYGTSWSERPWLRLLRGGSGRPVGVLLLLLLVAGLLTPKFSPFQQLRLMNFDAYQALAPRERASAPAVIVAIDDTSLNLHGQWPWPRTLMAKLITSIANAEPAVIGVDIVMPEPDQYSPARLPRVLPELDADIAARMERMESNEAALAAALGRAKSVLGAAGLDEPEPARSGSGGGWAVMRLFGGEPRPFVRRFQGVLRTIPEVDRAAAGRALLNADIERGVVRRVRLIAAIDDKAGASTLVPGFSLELLRVADGSPPVTVEVGTDGVRAVGFHDLRIPTERDGTLRVHYSHHDANRFVSAAEVLAGKVPADRFTSRIVLIGLTSTGLSDYKATPVAELMAGIEIHAQAIENIFDRSLLSRPVWAQWAEAAVLAIVGGLVIWAVPPLKRSYSLLLFFGAVITAWIVGFLLYREARVLVDVVSPTIALGLLFGLMVSVTLAEVDSHRRTLRRELEREREAAARLAGELEAARRIQMGILPRATDLTANGRAFDLHAFLEPARTVGGDFYDFFPLPPDRLFFLLGDVAGKGLPGCLFMAVSKSLYKSTALRHAGDTDAIMTEANAQIARENAESLFVTVFAGSLGLTTGRLEFSNAGHEPPYVVAAGKPLQQLPAVGGPPLCVLDEYDYEAAPYQLAPGDTLVVMTDGVMEAMNASGALYGRARLETVLGTVGGMKPVDLVEAIRADVARFTAGAEPADDLAILALRWNGSAPTT